MHMHLENKRRHPICRRSLADRLSQDFEVSFLITSETCKVFDLIDEVYDISDPAHLQKCFEDVNEVDTLRSFLPRPYLMPQKIDQLSGVVTAEFLNKGIIRSVCQLHVETTILAK